MDSASTSTKTGQALSGIFGCISLVAWICLLLPQLITNYKAKSADALSMGFLFIWMLGDLTNLAGALVTDLAPSAVAIGIYFCFADLILICQCLYYNAINARRRRDRQRHLSTNTEGSAISEEEPLLSRERSGSSGLPGSQRRHSVRRGSSGLDPLQRMVTGEDDTPQRSAWVTNTLSLLAVYILGIAAWFVSREVLGGDPGAPADGDAGAEEVEEPLMALGLALGYFSAVCYLCARIPQIIKNWREKSTEGLALLFFLLSLTGNSTYGASLVAYSQDGAYLLKALPWLLGSLGTIAEDMIIFGQFQLYSNKKDTKTTPDGNGHATLPEAEP
ncbi:PQ loop protein [Cryphonectria parasitica EP155]|uniref:PQ loop protein n=1 Tax=Cryphonectria parasitica (strain ATCC 38755 / EP155) TaxID=660469 RepID=A0A9P4Y140_CRYP1|nr:PQ loop protein [Cryphonectria parasitica EP155]KAF3765054.1 PQ loop protein [Cryphonectria parasitica EP155]